MRRREDEWVPHRFFCLRKSRQEPDPQGGQSGNEAEPKCLSLSSLPTEEKDVAATRARVTWCAVGSEEKRKCDEWNRASNGRVTCTSFPTTEDCITAIMVGSLGHVWCGQRASWAQAMGVCL